MLRRPVLVALSVLALAACGGGASDEPASGGAVSAPAASAPISGADLARRLADGTAPVVLDVRSEAEFAEGHLPGAILIPHDELAARLGELPPEARDEVVVHCRKGGRAAKAETVLHEAGYTNVRDLQGHWEGWVADGHPVAH